MIVSVGGRRRLVLGCLAGAVIFVTPGSNAELVKAGPPIGPKQLDQMPASEPTSTLQYGPDPLQSGELRLPDGRGPFPLAIVIHGGCWTKGYATARNTAAMASALTKLGVATWNIEYRQFGDDGAGWPGTFQDWAAATDFVRTIAKRHPVDLRRVFTVGHSAGAHAALWIAGRRRLPATSEVRGRNPLRVSGAVAIDGPGDLAALVGRDGKVCGRPVIAPFMGGTPQEMPDRYRQASPASLLPLGAPQYLVQSSVLAPEEAEAYRRTATARKDKVVVIPLEGQMHFNMIAPSDPTFAAVKRAVLALSRPSR